MNFQHHHHHQSPPPPPPSSGPKSFLHMLKLSDHLWSSMAKAPRALPDGHVRSAQNAAPNKRCSEVVPLLKFGKGQEWYKKGKTKLIHEVLTFTKSS